MKKLLVVATICMVGLGVATSAQAGSEGDEYPEIPDGCEAALPLTTVGPGRIVHAPAGGAPEIDSPDCADLDICVVFPALGGDDADIGPSRLPHVENVEDCGDVPDECIIDIGVSGPGRAVHPVGQPTPEPTIIPEETIFVKIPQECQEQLSLALAPGGPVVGSNSTPTILMASALVLIGGLLIIGQRRLARR